jgi:small subunit ribosomal protein S17e
MGRIKTKAVKRAARELVGKDPELFREDFEYNKKVLGNSMPSKKVRNMVTGYITRLKKMNKSILKENE